MKTEYYQCDWCKKTMTLMESCLKIQEERIIECFCTTCKIIQTKKKETDVVDDYDGQDGSLVIYPTDDDGTY